MGLRRIKYIVLRNDKKINSRTLEWFQKGETRSKDEWMIIIVWVIWWQSYLVLPVCVSTHAKSAKLITVQDNVAAAVATDFRPRLRQPPLCSVGGGGVFAHSLLPRFRIRLAAIWHNDNHTSYGRVQGANRR